MGSLEGGANEDCLYNMEPRSATIQDTLSKRHSLETSHKNSPTSELLADILLTRASLLQSLEVLHSSGQHRYALGRY